MTAQSFCDNDLPTSSVAFVTSPSSRPSGQKAFTTSPCSEHRGCTFLSEKTRGRPKWSVSAAAISPQDVPLDPLVVKNSEYSDKDLTTSEY